MKPVSGATFVELPSGSVFAEGGWVVYKPGLVSLCPEHQYCAYAGDEPDLCPICHTSLERGCSHQEFGGLPPGRRQPCLCSACGELFTSTTAFDIHRRPIGDPRGCYKPEKRGLVLIEQNGWVLWGKPGSPPTRDLFVYSSGGANLRRKRRKDYNARR